MLVRLFFCSSDRLSQFFSRLLFLGLLCSNCFKNWFFCPKIKTKTFFLKAIKSICLIQVLWEMQRKENNFISTLKTGKLKKFFSDLDKFWNFESLLLKCWNNQVYHWELNQATAWYRGSIRASHPALLGLNLATHERSVGFFNTIA